MLYRGGDTLPPSSSHSPSYPTMLQIEKVLVIHTSHAASLPLPPALTYGRDDDAGVEWTYGRWCREAVNADTFPDWIWPIVDLARESGCGWVRFDVDGQVVPGLPTFPQPDQG